MVDMIITRTHYGNIINFYNCPTQEDEDNLKLFRKEFANTEQLYHTYKKLPDVGKFFKEEIRHQQRLQKAANLILKAFHNGDVRIPKELLNETRYVMGLLV